MGRPKSHVDIIIIKTRHAFSDGSNFTKSLLYSELIFLFLDCNILLNMFIY